MTQFLTDSERAALRAKHKHERDKRVCDRIKAVLLSDKGWSYAEIASVLLLDEQTIFNHVQEYKMQNKLTCAHKGSEGKLSTAQTADLLEHLDQRTYLHVKDILAYVQAMFGITYTIPGMTHWLHNHGFSYKKPVIVPGKADRTCQEKWIQEYAQLKSALQPEETICFLDGVYSFKMIFWFLVSPASQSLTPPPSHLCLHRRCFGAGCAWFKSLAPTLPKFQKINLNEYTSYAQY